MTRSERIQVAALTLVALACRVPLAYGSGIWADEAMALNVVAIPSTSGMLDFLRLHESHPPLFYLVLRAWQQIAGTSDAAAFSLMLAIAVLIVPATHMVARSFMSSRAAFLAGLLVALSPALAEHSAQVRPYGLLPLFVLLSCHFLAESIDREGWGRWPAYVLFTTLMLYTHNWAWLVLAGQVVAGTIATFMLPSGGRRRFAIQFGVALLAVGVLFLPWLQALLFQSGRAGHAGVQVDAVSDLLAFYLFALVSIPDYLLLGLYPSRSLPLVLVAGTVAAVSVIAFTLKPGLSDRVARSAGRSDIRRARSSSPLLIFLVTSGVALGAAVIMSPWTALFIQRCVAMLTPLVLISIAAMIDRALTRRERAGPAVLGVGLLSFMVALEMTGIAALAPTSRSNAREVARSLQEKVRPQDLLVVAPEWFAPSFNHYFPPSVEQHDHPQTGRIELVDFAGPQRRSLDLSATRRLTRLVADARSSGRRVWLVTERTYLRHVDDLLPTLTTDAQRARYAPLRRVKEARDLLVDAYGPPDTTHFVRGRVTRYDELLPLLFQPPSGVRRPF